MGCACSCGRTDGYDDLDVMMVVHCVYCGCCEFVCAGGCGLGLYLYKFGHSCACDTRIIGL